MKRLALCAFVLAAACGKSADKTGNDKPASTPSTAGTPTGPRKLSVTGEIHLTGALSGTFTWKDDLAVNNCGWVDSSKVGGLDVTMSDGKDTFIALGAVVHDDGKHTIRLSSGKLKLPHASDLRGEGGFEMSGEMSKTHAPDSMVTVVYKNATVSADGQTATIDGQLVGNCNF